MSGITITEARKRRARFSQPYWRIGKCVLTRPKFRARIGGLDALDVLDILNRPDVRVGVNPGGTNAAFVETHLPRATVRVFADNLAIPEAVADGVVDVMLTDNVEALRVVHGREDLIAVRADDPFTDEALAYMVSQDDVDLETEVNNLLAALDKSGELERMRQKWLPSRSGVPARSRQLR